MKLLKFFLFLWGFFALLDPDPDQLTWLNLDPIRIRNTAGPLLPRLPLPGLSLVMPSPPLSPHFFVAWMTIIFLKCFSRCRWEINWKLGRTEWSHRRCMDCEKANRKLERYVITVVNLKASGRKLQLQVLLFYEKKLWQHCPFFSLGAGAFERFSMFTSP